MFFIGYILGVLTIPVGLMAYIYLWSPYGLFYKHKDYQAEVFKNREEALKNEL